MPTSTRCFTGFFIMKILLSGIYKIVSPAGRIYIGQSQDIVNRKYLYSICSCKGQMRVYNSIKKYGWENHIFEIIEECPIEDLNCRERYWQDFYDVLNKNGLNLVLTQCGETRKVVSEESKQKISIANSGENNGMFGHICSEEFKQARRNHKHSDEVKKIIGDSGRGEKNARAKLVLNLETGIYYGCVGDAAETLSHIKYDYLKHQLQGVRKSKTAFVYV